MIRTGEEFPLCDGSFQTPISVDERDASIILSPGYQLELQHGQRVQNRRGEVNHTDFTGNSPRERKVSTKTQLLIDQSMGSATNTTA
eukprot:g3881.t1